MPTQASIQDPVSKNNHSKKCWGVAQVAEHLSSKYKALNSNPRATKKGQKNAPEHFS
jgi:hypothetical protein